MQYASDILTGPLLIWALTAFGCIVGFMYCERKGIRNSEEFWKRAFPNRSSTFHFRMDFLASAAIGTVVAVFAYAPSTQVQALAAGLGWTAAFGVLKHDGKGSAKDDAEPSREPGPAAPATGG